MGNLNFLASFTYWLDMQAGICFCRPSPQPALRFDFLFCCKRVNAHLSHLSGWKEKQFCFKETVVKKRKTKSDLGLVGLLWFQPIVKLHFSLKISASCCFSRFLCSIIIWYPYSLTTQRPMSLWSIENVFNHENAHLCTLSVKGIDPN